MWTHSRKIPGSSPRESTSGKATRRFPFLLLSVFAFALFVLAGRAYLWAKQREIDLAHQNLAAVADLKQKEIVEWLADQKRNAEILSSQGLLASSIEQWIEAGRPSRGAERINKLLAVIQTVYKLKSLQFVDGQGLELLASGRNYPPLGAADIQQALGGQAARIGEIHPAEDGEPGVVHVNMTVPLFAKRGEAVRPIGALVYHIDLATFLYPLIQSWPTPSATAETLLVRREGDWVLFLNELRHRGGTALKLRAPLASDIPAARAIRGATGPLQGPDYRGVLVLADARPIPGTTWVMVAKQDLDEILLPVRRAFWIAMSLATVLIAGFGLVFRLWQGRQATTQALLSIECALKAARLEARFASLLRQANDMILLMNQDGVILDANQRAFEVYGYSRDRLIGMEAWQLCGSASLEPSDPGIVEFWKRQGGIPYETIHRRADGSPLSLEVNTGVLESDGEKFLQAIIRDNTRRKEAEQELRLAASVFANTQEGIVITDLDANIVEINQAFTRLTGYSREDALGRNPSFLKSGRHDPGFYADLWRTLREEGVWRGEIWNRRRDGVTYPQWLTISVAANEAGEPAHYIGAFSDITLLKQHEQRLEYMAYFDPLTGMPNRVLLADRMRQGIAYARRQEGLLAVAYLDLDGFKQVNDQFGHDIGDTVLVEIAHRIKSVLREGDTVARLGGDEFVVLLIGLETEECLAILRRILGKIAEPLFLKGQRLTVSASVGISLFPLDESDPDTLLRHADQAMYQAKQTGKNRVQIYDPVAGNRDRVRQERLARIEQALENREFMLFYQPKVDLRSGRVAGAEALIRWQHPERGLVPPGDFLPLVENHALGQKVDRWVMEEVLRQMVEWNGLGLDLAISVNVSAQSLQAADFSQNLADLLARFPTVAPHRYEIEILESAALDDLEYISRVMRDCQKLGLRFALDDFGTGYSSLTYLKHLPAETIKIDQSFVRDMLEDEEDLAIVEGVIGLARAFHRRAVAEGVETLAHGVELLSLGYDMAQGYGIARPMAAAAIPGWVRQWKAPAEWRNRIGGPRRAE